MIKLACCLYHAKWYTTSSADNPTRNLRTTRGKRGQWPKPSKQSMVVVGRYVLSTGIACILTDLLHNKCPNPTLTSMYSTGSCEPSPLPLTILSSPKLSAASCAALSSSFVGEGFEKEGGWLSVQTCRLDDECVRGLGLRLGLWKQLWRRCVRDSLASLIELLVEAVLILVIVTTRLNVSLPL